VNLGYDVHTCLVSEQDIPSLQTDFLLVMGGPMSANDSDPWMAQEIRFLQQSLTMNIPVIGVCLGAQLLAKALNTPVVAGPRFEIGMAPITLTEAGKQDPVFGSLPDTLDVFQWHGEGFEEPPGTMMLASSNDYPVQAFRFGTKVYGLLFHLEMNEEGVRALCRECPDDVRRGGVSPDILQQTAAQALPTTHQWADRLIAHLTEA